MQLTLPAWAHIRSGHRATVHLLPHPRRPPPPLSAISLIAAPTRRPPARLCYSVGGMNIERRRGKKIKVASRARQSTSRIDPPAEALRSEPHPSAPIFYALHQDLGSLLLLMLLASHPSVQDDRPVLL